MNRLALVYVQEHHFHSVVLWREIVIKHIAHRQSSRLRIIGMNEGKLKNFRTGKESRCVAVDRPHNVDHAIANLANQLGWLAAK